MKNTPLELVHFGLKTYNDQSEYYKYIGLTYACLGDTAAALEDFSKGLKQDSNNVGIYHSRLKVLYLKNKYDAQSIKDISKLIRVNANDSLELIDLYAYRGFLKVRNEDSVGALKDYLKSIELAKTDYEKSLVYYNLSCYYFILAGEHNYLKSEEYLKKSIEYNKENVEAYKLLAISYLQREGKKGESKAKSVLNKAVKISSINIKQIGDIKNIQKVIEKGIDEVKTHSDGDLAINLVLYMDLSSNVMKYLRGGFNKKPWY